MPQDSFILVLHWASTCSVHDITLLSFKSHCFLFFLHACKVSDAHNHRMACASQFHFTLRLQYAHSPHVNTHATQSEEKKKEEKPCALMCTHAHQHTRTSSQCVRWKVPGTRCLLSQMLAWRYRWLPHGDCSAETDHDLWTSSWTRCAHFYRRWAQEWEL